MKPANQILRGQKQLAAEAGSRRQLYRFFELGFLQKKFEGGLLVSSVCEIQAASLTLFDAVTDGSVRGRGRPGK
ncbi:MAG: hypothetical protein GZ085_00340 [Sulfuriferula multivorans]|uniref:Uncharacterized protein n=1 Tax=Sulfuriferula multivorans TaxID=1559896 RepID=A0A7C9NSJ5_9PROT|nr:hypothetical protein [Sulfuriferula multivorans]